MKFRAARPRPYSSRPMRALKLFACVWLVAGGLAVAAGNAVASQSPAADCNDHGYKLTQSYTVAELEHALATMPASIKEYTPCYQVIQQELDKVIGTGTGTGTGTTSSGSSSSFLSGPLIVIVIVLVLAGGGAAYLASRRKPSDGEDGQAGDQPAGGEDQPAGDEPPAGGEDEPAGDEPPAAEEPPGDGDDSPPPTRL